MVVPKEQAKEGGGVRKTTVDHISGTVLWQFLKLWSGLILINDHAIVYEIM